MQHTNIIIRLYVFVELTVSSLLPPLTLPHIELEYSLHIGIFIHSAPLSLHARILIDSFRQEE